MLKEDVKNILNKLFYDEKLGAGKKSDFIKKVREKYNNRKSTYIHHDLQ